MTITMEEAKGYIRDLDYEAIIELYNLYGPDGRFYFYKDEVEKYTGIAPRPGFIKECIHDFCYVDGEDIIGIEREEAVLSFIDDDDVMNLLAKVIVDNWGTNVA